MIYKELGASGIKVPAIVQGTSGFGSYTNSDLETVQERIAALRHGIDAGLNFIDTAELYGGGFSEEVVSRAISGIRNKVIISTKFNSRPNVQPAFEASLQGSLKRLKTDYVDLYQIHWPNPSIPLEPILEALYQAFKKGLIRSVGLSNFPLQYLKDAQSLFKGSIVSNQFEYNLFDRSIESDLLPYCEKENISLLGYSPLNQGRIAGSDEQLVLLNQLSQKYSKTVSQIVLRWLVSHKPVIAITKTKSVAYIQDAIEALNFTLNLEDIEAISDLKKIEPVSVPLSSIRLVAPPHRKLPATVEEARENKEDLLPSPAALAQIYTETGSFKPIRLNLTQDTSGKFQYDIDQYDVMDQVKKYWAWKMVRGDEPILAFILNKRI